ncbi:hypothetical protein GOBAR_AA18368 [Gossypium barbadense]|uniref:Uncharacterized protein n=1 Tax=Gossypium barbadense TaxID=3634 RepID=A0A2P5XG17_GOSBA|nr:hypothetical protein GOBAR_AA18368 [Gossypium barbadense]
MKDWEDEIPPLLAKEQLKSKWDDEDIDDSDIKKSWEDEDELASPPKSYHYIALIKPVMRLSLTSLEAADVKGFWHDAETKRIEGQGEYGK